MVCPLLAGNTCCAQAEIKRLLWSVKTPWPVGVKSEPVAPRRVASPRRTRWTTRAVPESDGSAARSDFDLRDYIEASVERGTEVF